MYLPTPPGGAVEAPPTSHVELQRNKARREAAWSWVEDIEAGQVRAGPQWPPGSLRGPGPEGEPRGEAEITVRWKMGRGFQTRRRY